MSVRISRLSVLLLLIGSLVFAGTSCSILGSKSSSNNSSTQDSQTQTIPVNVQLSYGSANKSERKMSVDISTGSTVFDALKKASEKNSFVIDYSNSDFGVFIKGIDGVAGDNTKFWLVYVNGKMIEVAADKQVLNASDTVEFRYGSGE